MMTIKKTEDKAMGRRTFFKMSGAAAGAAIAGAYGVTAPGTAEAQMCFRSDGACIVERAGQTPVLYEADVVVVGAGPAGIGAAIAAARNGANTIIIEKSNCAGGLQTMACNPVFTRIHPEVQGGIVTEIIGDLDAAGVMTPRPFPRPGGPEPTQFMEGFYKWFGSDFFNTAYYKHLIDTKMLDAGVKVLYHARAVAVIRKRDRVKGIIIESREGRHAIMGKVVIDTTGKGDIINKAGAPFRFESFESDISGGWGMAAWFMGNVDIAQFEPWYFYMSGYDLFPPELTISFGNSDKPNRWRILTTVELPDSKDSLTVEGITDIEMAFRAKAVVQFNWFKANAPGLENAFLERMPDETLTKAYKLVGEYTITLEDILEVRQFDDAVGVCNWPPDIWNEDGPNEFLYQMMPYDVPYGALISAEVDNLMAAGNLVSTDGGPGRSLNYCVPSMTTGQAAGTAAALAVSKSMYRMKDMNIALLQDALRSQGVVVTIDDVPDEVMNQYAEVIQKYAELRGDA